MITDVFPRNAPDCVTLIRSREGSVRGNHVHHFSKQSALVVSGCMAAYSRASQTSPVERHDLYPGDLVTHPPGEEHAYVAISDVILIAFADGLRKGDDYEKDTHRVPSLVDAWDAQNRTDAASGGEGGESRADGAQRSPTEPVR